jgi:hypothetical protein
MMKKILLIKFEGNGDGVYFSTVKNGKKCSVKWCLHCGENCSKLGLFKNAKNIYLNALA